MNIEDTIQKLREYFVEKVILRNDDYLLEILDEGSKIARERGGYTGVTIPYIKEYVLEDKDFSDTILFFILGLLVERKELFFIACGDINQLVVENYYTRSFRSTERLDRALKHYINAK